jgi:hypothetical protein
MVVCHTPTTNVANSEPHNLEKADLDPYRSEKLGPDPHQSQTRTQIRIKVKIQELWRLKWTHGGPQTLAKTDPDPQHCQQQILNVPD